MKKNINGIYGVLNFVDGRELDLEAMNKNQVKKLIDELKTLPTNDIIDFGTKDIGDEAHVYVTYSNGNYQILDELQDVKSFINFVINL